MKRLLRASATLAGWLLALGAAFAADGPTLSRVRETGVIVIGDPRIRTKAYGRVFLESMPPSPIVTNGASAAQFLTDRLRALTAMPAASRAT